MPPWSLTRATDEGQVRPALPDNAQLLRLEECPPSLPKGNLGLPIAPDRPARLQFTSGSTGTPKPILKTHRQKLYSVWQYVNNYHCGRRPSRLDLPAQQQRGLVLSFSTRCCPAVHSTSMMAPALPAPWRSGSTNMRLPPSNCPLLPCAVIDNARR